MSETAPRGTLGTVHNAALLLELLSDGPAHHQLTDLAERSQMSLPTLHRLLRSLVAAGLVEQDSRSSRYGLGPQLVRLAEQYLARSPVLKVAGPYLVELRNTTKGTVRLIALVDTDAVEIDRVDGEDVGGIFRDASRVAPALGSAAGRLLLARADEKTWQRAVGHAHAPTATDADRARWARSDRLTLPAATSADRPEVAAPVIGEGGETLAALAVTGSATTFGHERLEHDVAPQLERAARTLSRALGHG